MLIYLLDNEKHSVPGIGKLLSPSHGMWKNAASANKSNKELLVVNTPDGKVNVYYDERGVPHLFASNEKALYYAQGYVQARDRLWQMDFQVRIAGGELSQVIGEDGLTYDRYFRRIGIPKAADEIIDSLGNDPLNVIVMNSFTEGVNAYINKLHPKDYPMEFKMVNYQPEPWSLRKSILLLKLMSFRLSGYDTDVSNSNTLKLMNRETFDELYPTFPDQQSPIIPSGTRYNFSPTPTPADFVGVPVEEFNDAGESESETIETDAYSYMLPPIPYQKGIGSNNWAVGKQKTADGGAILCNDPHLGLAFPSIWYEMQLHSPDLNVYGVTIPGSPCIIIGFNEQIAWGVTNGGRDVRDWYSVRYKDDSQKEYLFEGSYQPIDERIETIKVKNSKDVIDTVKWTSVGPVVYDNSFGSVESNKGLAVRWLALDVSNELKTFYELNRAADHSEYLAALKHYQNPAQNFVFADRDGNIAIKQQGKFRVKEADDGHFIEPLESQSEEKLNTFIPLDHNPHVYNPPRGFVSSANQNPTDSTYPYNYSGWFERYRNRRINHLLDSLSDLTTDDMKWLQNDTYNLMAKEILPTLIEKLSGNSISDEGAGILDSLKAWNFYNWHYAAAPSYFQKWFVDLKALLWDEMADTTKFYRIPLDYESFNFMINHPDHDLIDNKTTSVTETVEMMIDQSFNSMVDSFSTEGIQPQWQYYNSPSIEHLMKLEAFSSYDLPIGGCENSVNATNATFGPSWRMIVRLNGDGINAFGVYPGGPSGNPADINYNSFVDEWAAGKYFQLHFYQNMEEADQDLTKE